jgi:DNA-directed RNA polymerase subunit omega
LPERGRQPFRAGADGAKRARQLSNGIESTLDNSDNEDKPTVLALREIAARRSTRRRSTRSSVRARAQAEREALEWAAAEVVDDDKGRRHLSHRP